MPPKKIVDKKSKKESKSNNEDLYSSDEESSDNIVAKKNVPVQSDEKGEYTIEVHVPSTINTILRYIEEKSKFFNTHVSKKLVMVNNQFHTYYTDPVVFDDTEFGISGNITWNFQEQTPQEISRREEQKLYLKMNIKNFSKEKKCYIKYITTYVDNISKNGQYVSLYYYKILNDTIITYRYYHQTVEQWRRDVKLVIGEFFSVHKKYIFSIFNKKQKVGNAASSWNNFIFHGKPGTGKSSTIYRIALFLKMNIISLDLSLYINKKKELYSIFYGENSTLPNGDPIDAIKDAIIVLEEFDYSIDKQIHIENMFKVKDFMKKEYVNSKTAEIKESHRKISDLKEMPLPPVLQPQVLQPQVYQPQANIQPAPYAYAPYDPSQNQQQQQQIHQQNQFRQAKENFLNPNPGSRSNFNEAFSTRESLIDKRNLDNNISMIENELIKCVQDTENNSKSNILRISDLLELFQGPVPVNDRIIIATTNHYERIKAALPALFRSGRLTPINMDYLNWENFQELCKTYFGTTCTLEPRVIDLATSTIVEIAIKHAGTEIGPSIGGIDNFLKEVFSTKPT